MLGGFGSPCADRRAGPNCLILLLNRHDPSGVGSLASVPAPQRVTGCPHLQPREQPEEQAVEQAVPQPVEQAVHQGVEQAVEQSEAQPV